MLRREFEISSRDPGGHEWLECRINSEGQAEIVAINGPQESVIYLDAEEVKRLRAALAKIDDPKTWRYGGDADDGP